MSKKLWEEPDKLWEEPDKLLLMLGEGGSHLRPVEKLSTLPGILVQDADAQSNEILHTRPILSQNLLRMPFC